MPPFMNSDYAPSSAASSHTPPQTQDQASEASAEGDGVSPNQKAGPSRINGSAKLPGHVRRGKRLDFFRSMLGQHMHASPSPLGRFLGGILEHVEPGHMRARFEPEERWMNPFGSWHGGTLSAMVDDMIGATVHALDLEHNFSTVNLHLDFLSWAEGDQAITVSTRIVRQGRQMIHAKAELHQQERLLATATANLLRVGVPLHEG